MNAYLDQGIKAMSQLGRVMGVLARNEPWPGFDCGLSEDEYAALQELILTHHHYNGWFTAENIRKAMDAWSSALTEQNLQQWLSIYTFPDTPSDKQVGIICAGNIPMVGLHDVVSVLLSGNKALIKLSSSDDKLIPALMKVLCYFAPEFVSRICYVSQKMTGQQAVIATGSNNTSRYFKYYFKDIPHIIRKSRTSVAIIADSDGPEDLRALGSDIFDYFGLGCRNVSKVYFPKGFDLNRFFNAIYEFNPIVNHNKYANNYDYNKAVWLLNQENLLDNGFILLKEEKSLASPTASLYYEYYQEEHSLRSELSDKMEEIQCIVGKKDIPFGCSQQPMLWDYADGVDTMAFLLSIP